MSADQLREYESKKTEIDLINWDNRGSNDDFTPLSRYIHGVLNNSTYKNIMKENHDHQKFRREGVWLQNDISDELIDGLVKEGYECPSCQWVSVYSLKKKREEENIGKKEETEERKNIMMIIIILLFIYNLSEIIIGSDSTK